MKLSKRESVIAVGALLALSLLAADQYVLTPLMDSYAAMESEKQRLVLELQSAARLFRRRRLMARRWEEMTAGGLAADSSVAEGRVLHAVRDWAQETGLTLSSLKPERGEERQELGEITVLASGTGPMRSVARFLWRVESAELPLRVREMQIGSRTEGTDDLSLQLSLSTVYRREDAESEGEQT